MLDTTSVPRRSSTMRQPKFPVCLAAMALCLALTLCGCRDRTPPGPDTVSAYLSASTEITIVWSKVEGAGAYRLFRQAEGEDHFQYLCDCTGTNYTDTTCLPGQRYTYKVRASIDGVQSHSTYSEPIDMIAAPNLVLGQYTQDGGVELIWQSTGAASYIVYQSESEQDGFSELARTSEPSYICPPDPEQDCLYFYIVGVYQTDGGELLSQPSNVVALLGSTEITSVTQMDRFTSVVQFTPVSGASSYRIYRSDDPAGEFSYCATVYEPVYYDDDAPLGSSYFYQVMPLSPRGEGRLSAAAATGTNPGTVSSLLCIMYHEFVTQEDLDAGVAFDEYAVWAEEFEADLQWIQENGYTTVTSQEVYDYLCRRQPLPEKAIWLTIDDGKLGVYKHAWPLLKQYNMKASLNLIGEEIDKATQRPEDRASQAAPYCTWQELQQMSDSGAIELTSHTYYRHRYDNDGHKGADIANGESVEAFYTLCQKDATKMRQTLLSITGRQAVCMAYPYSARSRASDWVWLQCGYQILLAGSGSDARQAQQNFYVDGAGVNTYSAVTRRLVRYTGVPLSSYVADAIAHDTPQEEQP